MVVKKILIKGRVQNVGFRYALLDMAVKKNLKGYVRNCPDGSVEAMLFGTDATVDMLIEWAKTGPPGSRVDGVEISDEVGEFDSFEIRAS